jgi:hypothetical protein
MHDGGGGVKAKVPPAIAPVLKAQWWQNKGGEDNGGWTDGIDAIIFTRSRDSHKIVADAWGFSVPANHSVEQRFSESFQLRA